MSINPPSNERDIFYDCSEIDFETKLFILEDFIKVNTVWWVDYLNCEEDWRRQKTSMRYEDAIKLFPSDSSHLTIIHRKGWDRQLPGQFCGEACINTTDFSIRWFIWVVITEDKLQNIIEKYKLKPKYVS